MGLTFKKQDELEKLFDKFATVPDDKKKKVAKNKDKIVKDKDN
ncbi:SPJ_0845 family protein [Lactobacillus kimbladii]|nr:SPJ_0845 family protein [Lactobacillus kimbladii]